MRSFAFIALLGSFIVSASLFGQSLTEHAAAAAGATIGTAAGKPLGTALSDVFGAVDKNTSAAAGPKTAKPVPVKPVAAAPALAPARSTELSAEVASSTGGGGHHASRRKDLTLDPGPVAAAPITPIIAVPVVKEPSPQEVASIKVGATDSELRKALGAPESMVSIPGDDGHLLEICQYWAKGEQIGTIRLDNGRVVSVQASN
jgi:hypothetical protein